MSRPHFTPAQRKLQDEMLAKFEQGSRREVRQTLNSLKGQFRKALHVTVKALRSESDGRKARKLGREAQETRKMLQTIENVKRRIKTITARETKDKTIVGNKAPASAAQTAPVEQAPVIEKPVETQAPVLAPVPAPAPAPVEPSTAAVVAQMTAPVAPKDAPAAA